MESEIPDQLYAVLGRKQLQLEEQDRSYTALLNLLVGVLCGDIEPSRVLVNLTDRTWRVSEPGTSPGMPATINGLPRCIVGQSGPDLAAVIEKLKNNAEISEQITSAVQGTQSAVPTTN